MMRSVSDPDDTAPFTHQPYGKGADDNPYVSPSGPSADPSGPGFVTPPSPPPPTVGPAYGQQPVYPPAGQPPGYPAGWAPGYLPYALTQKHQGANTSLVLGIISVASVVVGLACCLITFPGVLCAPFAWGIGARAKREIERQPGVYGNLSSAQAGMWMGVVMTFVALLVVACGVALVVWFDHYDPSLV